MRQSAHLVLNTITVGNFAYSVFACLHAGGSSVRLLPVTIRKKRFFFSSDHIGYKLWSCQNVCDDLSYLLDKIYIRFGNKLYRKIVGIPMGTNCAPLVADLLFFCYEIDFMTSLSDDNQADY